MSLIPQSIVTNMKTLITSLVAIAVLSFPHFCFADVVVIVHPSHPNDSMSSTEIERYYMGKTISFQNGRTAIPLDLPQGSYESEIFLHEVIGRTDAQYQAYWSRLFFTRKGTPPKVIATSAAVMATVANNRDAIGYVDESVVDASVKVVYRIAASDQPMAASDQPIAASDQPALLKAKGCLACHQLYTRVVGPAYKDIAIKYTARDSAYLVQKVLEGSVGVWGAVPMPPNKALGLTEAEAQELVDWILSLK